MPGRSLFQEFGSKQTRRREDERCTMLEVTSKHLTELEEDSVFFAKTPLRSIAKLDPCEIETDQRIGTGEFGVVLEVARITLKPEEPQRESSATSTEDASTSAPRGPSHQRPSHVKNSRSCGSLTNLSWHLEDSPLDPSPFDMTPAAGPPDFRSAELQNKQLREHLASRLYREPKTTDQRYAQQTSPLSSSMISSLRKPSPALTPLTSSSSAADRPLQQRRYAVKQIRKDLYPKRKMEAGKDLAKEAMLLGRLEHPNIVKMRATVGRPGEESFAILLDRLGPTLGELVDDWHRRVEDNKAGYLFPWGASFFGPKRAPERVVLAERLLALYDAAQALHFLHRNSIIFRDLKTENVARNHYGAFQLLDFGLAKEVKSRDRWHRSDDAEKPIHDHSSIKREESSISGNMPSPPPPPHRSSSFHQPSLMDDRYRMTGLTGTVRIMSPEVLECQPYGFSADVYSFGILVWEVFRGQRNRLTAAEVTKGQRPELPVEGMPPRVESLVRKCYGEPAYRPTFAMLCQEFEYQLFDLHDQQQRDVSAAATTHGSCHPSGKLSPLESCLCSETQSPFLHRADYLRQLSFQSFATIPSSGAFTTVEQ